MCSAYVERGMTACLASFSVVFDYFVIKFCFSTHTNRAESQDR